MRGYLWRLAPGSGMGKHFASASGTLRLAAGQNPLFVVFQAGSVEKKASFLDLNPKQSHAINKDPYTLFYSFKNIDDQSKGQTSEIQGEISPPFILARVCFSFVSL